MKQNKTVYIGLTGGIGSGKSAAAKILEELGAYIIDTDVISRELVKKGAHGAVALEAEFGAEFFIDGELDRRRLREFAFASKANTERLNSVMRALIKEEMCAAMENADADIVVVVVPLLFESGWQTLFDEVWLVCAFLETRIKRVTERDNIGRDNTLAIMNSQMSDAYKKRMANIVFNNNSTLKVLRKNLEKEYARIINKIKGEPAE